MIKPCFCHKVHREHRQSITIRVTRHKRPNWTIRLREEAKLNHEADRKGEAWLYNIFTSQSRSTCWKRELSHEKSARKRENFFKAKQLKRKMGTSQVMCQRQKRQFNKKGSMLKREEKAKLKATGHMDGWSTKTKPTQKSKTTTIPLSRTVMLFSVVIRPTPSRFCLTSAQNKTD